MKKKDFEALKNKSISELKKEIAKVVKEINETKISNALNKAKNVHIVLNKKKEVAKFKTLINEKLFIEKMEVLKKTTKIK